jgi:hypothetical protein
MTTPTAKAPVILDVITDAITDAQGWCMVLVLHFNAKARDFTW